MGFKNRVGERQGKLYVIRAVREVVRGKQRVKWECQCDCGNIHITQLGKGIISCGCSRKDKEDYHGLKGTRFYKAWSGMKARCLIKSHTSYEKYGGRGITVSDEWLNFKNFKNDMYESYLEHSEKYGEKNTTLERLNVNGGYNQNNCKWATRKEQANNRSSSRYFEYNGKQYTASEIAELTNRPYPTIYHKLAKQHVSIKEILEEVN